MTHTLMQIIKNDLVKIILLVTAVIILTSIYPATGACADLYTIGASNITPGSADLNMVVNVSQDVWFEFGIASGDYKLQTQNITSGSSTNISDTIKGTYLFPGQKYYYRASCNNCSGDEYNFTLNTSTPIPTRTFSTYITEFQDAEWNISALVPIVGGPYEDAFASLGAPAVFFYAIVWLFIFAALWMRQENMLVPMMLFVILLPVVAFSGFLPGQWVNISYMIVVVCIATLFYYIFKGR